VTSLRRSHRASQRARHERARRERGFALAAALLGVVLAGTVAAALAELARLEVVLARLRRATVDALAAVDGCLHAAVAALPAGWDFDAVIVGADGTAGTADDGVVPLAAACSGVARAAPGPAAPPRILLALEASRGRGRRRLDALVGRTVQPGAGALVWLASPAGIGAVGGTFALDGNGPTRPMASLAAPAEPAALDAWIAVQGSAVTVSSGTGAPIWAPPPPLQALAARAASAGAVSAAAGLVGAPPAPPAVILAPGDLHVDTPRAGAGVLVVDGVLRLQAPLEFTGVVAALGGLRVEATGSLDVHGALWLGDESIDPLVIDGTAAIHASAAALDVADSLLSLPRRARVASVMDF